MTNEEQLVRRIDRMEKEIRDVAESARAVNELRDQLAPRVNEAVHALIVELADIEEDFQLEDLVFFTKNLLRNIRNINFALEQLKNLIDFARAIEPLLKSSIPQLIGTFDAWEQRGLFRLVTEVPEKIDFSRSREVGLLGLMQAMGDREVRAGMGALLEMARGLSALKPEQSVG